VRSLVINSAIHTNKRLVATHIEKRIVPVIIFFLLLIGFARPASASGLADKASVPRTWPANELTTCAYSKTCVATERAKPRRVKPAGQKNDAKRIINKTQPGSKSSESESKTKGPKKKKSDGEKKKDSSAASITEAEKTATTEPDKASDKKSVETETETRTGSITVNLDFFDDDTTVLLDGESLDSVGAFVEAISENKIEIRNVPFGVHRVRIKHPAINDVEQRVEVASPMHFINLSFEIVAAILTIVTEPGAEVLVDGKRACIVPLSGEARVYLAPGLHTIRIEKPGYEAAQDRREYTIGNLVITLRLNRVNRK
jgi:hypothetical protein